jgi:hypothetical protein
MQPPDARAETDEPPPASSRPDFRNIAENHAYRLQSEWI